MYFCGKSDIGKRRQVNQDSVCAVNVWNGEAVLLIVCDGMGGHKAGEIASRTAIEVFYDKIATSPCYEATSESILEFIRYILVCAASDANAAVHSLAGENDEFLGMGTTLVAVLIYKGYFYAINIGDSRFYIVTRHETRQVSKDHSFVQYLIDNGKLSPEEAKSYPRKNVITRAIGVSEKLDVDFFNAPLEPWESGYLLLCSDGLSNYIDEKILTDILYDATTVNINPETELSRKADRLIAYANEKGGNDNISVVLAKF